MSQGIAAGLPPQLPPRSARGDADGPVCPECWAKRVTSASVPCWMCGAMLPALESPVRNSAVRGREDNPAFIFIGVLLILVMIGLAIEAPGLLIVLALAATPALIRSVVVANRAKAAGQSLSAGEGIGAFLGALGSVVLVAAAAGVAFFATCFVVCLGMLGVSNTHGGDNAIWVVSIGAGLVPGILVFVWLIRLLWAKRKT